MGFSCCCISRRRNLPFLLLPLLLLCSTKVSFLAEGREISMLLQVASLGAQEKVMVRATIGSRPPSCERRCATCAHCEAVQVPAVPEDWNGARHFSTEFNSRIDDSSNYKPDGMAVITVADGLRKLANRITHSTLPNFGSERSRKSSVFSFSFTIVLGWYIMLFN